jgi:hypothetical protein
VFALAFVYSSSARDNAVLWTQLSAAQRASIKSEYNAAGISLIVSAFGGGPTPTSDGDDPTAAANYIANYVKTYGLDGVDVDYEVSLDHNFVFTFIIGFGRTSPQWKQLAPLLRGYLPSPKPSALSFLKANTFLLTLPSPRGSVPDYGRAMVILGFMLLWEASSIGTTFR